MSQNSVIDQLMMQTLFTREELLNLQSNFKALSSSITDDGLIDRTEFRRFMASHGDTIFIDSLFRMFDRDNSGTVDFAELVMTLAMYQNKSRNADEKQKKQLFFRVFDVDQDNEISARDLSTVLQSCFRSNGMQVANEEIECLVRDTMAKYTLSARGGITLDAYAARAFQNPVTFM